MFLIMASPVTASNSMILTRAVMCESIEGIEPVHVSVVFPISLGKLSCYTSFDKIQRSTYTIHRWYRYDKLVTTKRLLLKPPRWATYSSIQLREADKGPWRVEIWGADGLLLETLRFSVTG
ncbi:MAG: DUF2914 domain-containing protein [Desulfobacteraceae bacterium]|nr:DUF2914 domain-containing protein [Desulfobacteraceae bacterium]